MIPKSPQNPLFFFVTYMVVKLDLNRSEVIYSLLKNHAQKETRKNYAETITTFFYSKNIWLCDATPGGVYNIHRIYTIIPS